MVTLNNAAFAFAKDLIATGRVVHDERDAWSEHQPSTSAENAFIRDHGYTEYGKWHLGVNDEFPADTKRHYSFPYGDFTKIHRCAILTAESRAGQYKHLDIERAAADLHGRIDHITHPLPR